VAKHTDSLAELSRTLTCLVGRERRRQMVQDMATRAGVDLSPAACWLLVRLDEDPHADIPELCSAWDVPLEVGERALAELQERPMLRFPSGPDQDGERRPSAAGEEVVARLIAERRTSLAKLLDGWSADEHPEVASLLTRLAGELAAEPPPRVGAAA
jgi:hypothetical protein